MKRFTDWYKLQQDYQGWNGITPDNLVFEKLKTKNWSLDLSHCHQSLKQQLASVSNQKQQTDFFVLTDIELGKLPLDVFFKIVKHNYEKSKFGGYIAVLSYYLNVRTPNSNLTGSYKENIELTFADNLSYVNNIENVSEVNDYPIHLVENNDLLEGRNFIFVHPNIRYFLWK